MTDDLIIDAMANAIANHDDFLEGEMEASAERGCGYYDGLREDVMKNIRGMAEAALCAYRQLELKDTTP